MASLTGSIEIEFAVDGRDEETVRRFTESLRNSLEEATGLAAHLFSGVELASVNGTVGGMTVRK